MRTLLGLALAALALGCSSIHPDGGGSASEPIVGGKVASSFPEAAYLNIDMTPTGGYACSAALIAPSVVLTAGHCVDGHKTWEVHVGSSVTTSTSATTYDWAEHGSTTVNPAHHDIALVFLPTPISIAAYPSLARAPLGAGATVTNVGRVLDGSITATLYAADSTVSDGATIGYPFDYQSSDVIQPGDSGGPDFQSGTHVIVAVNSGAGSGVEVLARVDLLAAWIDGQVAAHGGYASVAVPPIADAGVADAHGSEAGASSPSDAGIPRPPVGDAGFSCSGAAVVEPADSLAHANALAVGTRCGAVSGGSADWFTVAATAGTSAVEIASSGDASFDLGQVVAGTCSLTLTGLRSVSLGEDAATTLCLRVRSPSKASVAYALTRR
jgi:hypothetical protein